jgi:hypothetical protein
VRLPIALGTIERNGGELATFPHFLQLLDKGFKLLSSHIWPVYFSLIVHFNLTVHFSPIVQFESNWHLRTDKWEWKCVYKFGVGKFGDGSGKRIGAFARIQMLVRRAVKTYNDLLNTLPLLVCSGGEFPQWRFPTNSFQRNGRLRCLYFIVLLLAGCPYAISKMLLSFLFLPAV